MTVSWEELAGLALARQFPAVDVAGPGGVAEAVAQVGPIQSQTARSPFLGLAARFPGVTHAEVSAAYDELAIVRGSTIRGTVHTCVPAQHGPLEVATRQGQGRLWQRTLGLDAAQVEALHAATEAFAWEEWRTPDELVEHLRGWVREHGGATTTALDSTFTRYLAFGHGGLVRRPLRGGWEGQGAAGYRTAAALVAVRGPGVGDGGALDALVRLHLAAHGPASRHDLAWWSGLGLTVVDEVLSRLDLETVAGPDGHLCVDLPEPPAPRDLPGVRLLPEFDALFCAYHPSGRLRFASQHHHDVLWGAANGLVRPALLVDGRITGCWRASGSARRRPLEVVHFTGTRRPRRAELEQPVQALEAALGITITEVTIRREAA